MKRKKTERRTMQGYLTLQKRIMRRLKEAGMEGMSRSELYRSLGSPITRRSMDIALTALKERSLAEARRVETGMRGRPKEIWWARGEAPKEIA